MYSGPLRDIFQPDSSAWKHAEQRQEYIRKLQQDSEHPPIPGGEEPRFLPETPVDREDPTPRPPQNLQQLLDLVSPEDSALIALIVFLLCDNTNNDVVLLGILLYVLLSK